MKTQEEFSKDLKDYCNKMEKLEKDLELLSYESMRDKADEMYEKANPWQLLANLEIPEIVFIVFVLGIFFLVVYAVFRSLI